MGFSVAVAERGLTSPYDALIASLVGGDRSLIALVKGHIATESAWDPSAVNPADPSYGLMQILQGPSGPYPATTAQELLDPETNIRLGTQYILDNIRRFGLPDAIAAYNAGTPRKNSAGQFVNSRGDTGVQAYVDSVLTYQSWYLTNDGPAWSGGLSDILRGPYDPGLPSATETPVEWGGGLSDILRGVYDPTVPSEEPSPDWPLPAPGESTLAVAGGAVVFLLVAGAAILLLRR